MQRLAFFMRPSGLTVLLAVALVLALFGYITAPGLSGTGDSRYYLHAARTCLERGQLLHPDGSAYRYWPPLYPLLLAAIGSSPAAIRVLHGAALIGTLLLWTRLGRQLLPSGPAQWVWPLLLALSTSALVMSKFVWAETVFGFLVAAYLLALWRWQQSRRAGWGLLATAIGALLPLHRTAGFFLLAGVGVALIITWVQARKSAPQPSAVGPFKLWQLVLHGTGCVAGGVAWHYYSLLLAAPAFFQQNRGWAQLLNSAADYGLVLARWLVPVPASWRTGPGASALWALVLAGLLLALWPIRPRHQKHALPRPSTISSAEESLTSAAPEIAFTHALNFRRLLWWSIAVYTIIMLVSTTLTRSAAGLYDAERYASILFAPVLLLALSRVPARVHEARRWVAGTALAALLLYSAARVWQNARQLRERPVLSEQSGLSGHEKPATLPNITLRTKGQDSGPRVPV